MKKSSNLALFFLASVCASAHAEGLAKDVCKNWRCAKPCVAEHRSLISDGQDHAEWQKYESAMIQIVGTVDGGRFMLIDGKETITRGTRDDWRRWLEGYENYKGNLSAGNHFIACVKKWGLSNM